MNIEVCDDKENIRYLIKRLIEKYAVSAAVLGDCRIRYKGCLEKAVFTLLLLYNFYGMSFLVSNSLYQFLMDGLLGLWTSGSKVLMAIHPCRCILTAVLWDKIQWKQKEIDDRVKASEKNGPTLR